MAELNLKRMGETLTVTLAEYRAVVPWAEVVWNEHTAQRIYDDAGAYGRTLFEQVFHDEALRSALLALPLNERLAVLTEDPEVAAVPWEYLRDPNDMLLAARLNMVRYVAGGPHPPPESTHPLTIVAVPVSPVDEARPLNTEQEWRRLIEAVSAPHKALSLLRVRPPTLAQLEQALPGEGIAIVHFMGHSGIVQGKSVLEFEDPRGRSQPIDAAYFADALDEQVFLVILNSCLSAAALPTAFGNVARAVVRQGVPYALGMQFVLLDDAALEMSKTLYQHLLQGRNIEEAVRRTRRAVEHNTLLHRPQWVAGIPVLYTHLREPAPAIRLETGTATISPDPAHLQATCDLTALPQALHFVGRAQEISGTLECLLAPAACGFVLLHGLGGIGKTALASVIAERASWFYRDRVLALSFETFATQGNKQTLTVSETFADRFYTRLARFYGLDPSIYPTTRDMQDAILQQRVRTRSLLVLDNMETLIEAQKQGHATARTVAAFLSRLQEGDGAILLTSRSEPPADWGACISIAIAGLSEEASADLFLALLPANRRPAAASEARLALARRVQGHPLSLRLLAGRFAESTADLPTFLSQIEEELKHAEQTTPSSLEDPERQRTLYACMDYSITRLMPEQKQVLHACSLFLAPFLPEFVEMLLEDESEQTAELLQQLVRLGLLERKTRTFPEGTLTLLEMHPMLHWYLQNRFPEVPPEWEQSYGLIYERLARQAYQPEGGYDQNAWMRFLIRQSLPDCETALGRLAPSGRSALAYHLAMLYERMGQNRRALALYELALELCQATEDMRGVAMTQHAMADVLKRQGRLQEALVLYEASLQRKGDLRDVQQVAVTQHAMAEVLILQGRTREAMALYEASLQTAKEHGEVREVEVTQSAMAQLLILQGKLQEAMALYEESLQMQKNLGDVREVAGTQHAMAEALIRQGRLQEAMALYEASLQTAKNLGDVRAVTVTQTSMAEALIRQGRLQEAMALYEESLQTAKNMGDMKTVAAIQYGMAEALKQQGKSQEAMALYEESLQIAKNLGDVQAVAVTQHAMAEALTLQGKLQEALAFYEVSLQTKKNVGDVHGVLSTEVHLAQLLFELGEYDRGLSLAWDAYNQLQTHGYAYDAQTTQSILVALKETYFSQFTLAWERQIQEEQPGWLRGVQERTVSQLRPLSSEERRVIITNTIVVMTEMPEKRAEWSQVLSTYFQQAQEGSATLEAEYFVALLSLIDGQAAALSADHPYAEDLAEVEQGLVAAQAGAPTAIEMSEDVVQAVRDLLTTKNWEETHQALVQQQALLFQPAVEEWLQQQIVRAKNAGEQQAAAILILHLELLRESKTQGIERAFALLHRRPRYLLLSNWFPGVEPPCVEGQRRR